ncbi:replication initiator protein A [Leuconostoc lactis]|uniref:replication initiator protein A n=1 Tax=Leuconostoc lactis TaxID=1246 RepID=UPI0015624539|nr:replication initiator protein A [Leuconostoc lactis]
MTNNPEIRPKMERVSRQQVETNERFYKIPKALFENKDYAQMKLETKMAYAILRDRFLLSIKNNWVDSNGHVYLIYKNSDLQTILNAGEKKIISLKKELAAFGLLEEERQGLNKPNRLYIGNVNPDFRVIHRAEPLGDKELSKRQFRNSQNDSSRTVKTAVQELSKRQSSETKLSETELSETKIKKFFDFKDEDDMNNMSRKSANDNLETRTGNAMICGELIQANPILRRLVLNQFGDLLVECPETMINILKSLITNYQTLVKLFEQGNTRLAHLVKIHGEEKGLLILLEQATSHQLEYMQKHLVNDNFFDIYFAKGLSNRINILAKVPLTSPV